MHTAKISYVVALDIVVRNAVDYEGDAAADGDVLIQMLFVTLPKSGA